MSSAELATATGALDDAVTAWERLGIDSYVVVVDQTDQTAEGGCRWITEVHGDVVDSRWVSDFDSDCDEWDVSVPALHQDIATWADEVNGNVGSLVVEWTDSGVPASIEFDPSDPEGQDLSVVVDFEDLTSDASVRTELANARARWSQAGIDSYRLEVSEDRNYWSQGCRWVTVVTDGLVTDAFVDPASTSSDCVEVEWTVEQLHEMIARSADAVDRFSEPEFGEHTLEVTFDEIGVPQIFNFDLANGNDEESSLRASLTVSP